FNKDSLIMENDVFLKTNELQLGDVVQSVSIADHNAYIVVNNSQKIEVIDIVNFKSVATIFGLSYPRYFLQVSDKIGYISNGSFEGKLFVVDLDKIEIIDSINVGFGPEVIAKSGNYAYVANSGGWSYDNTISVIDITINTVINTIEVGDNPVDIEIDLNGDLWVLCKGKVVYDINPPYLVIEETASKLVQILSSDYSILNEIPIGQTGDYYNPSCLAISKDKKVIYFTEADGLYSIDCENPDLSPDLISTKSFTGLAVDTKEEIIYGFSSPSYTSSGYMYRYKYDGELIDSFAVGIGPNGAAFFTLQQ
ncbi:DUF5074 domain-containing protein, partial [Bacteroidota bacterium]